MCEEYVKSLEEEIERLERIKDAYEELKKIEISLSIDERLKCNIHISAWQFTNIESESKVYREKAIENIVCMLKERLVDNFPEASREINQINFKRSF